MNDQLTSYFFKIENCTVKEYSLVKDRALLTYYISSNEQIKRVLQILSKRQELVFGFYLKSEEFYKELTIEENIELSENLTRESLIPIEELVSLFELNDKRKLPCKKLSNKYCERMGMALSLIPRPDIAIWETPDIGDKLFFDRISNWFNHNKIVLLYS